MRTGLISVAARRVAADDVPYKQHHMCRDCLLYGRSLPTFRRKIITPFSG